MTVSPSTATVRELWPLLFVEDLPRSLEFYRDRLGFETAGEAQADGRVFWCRLRRGGASIMLQQAEAEDGPAQSRGRGVALYLVCDDVDALRQEFVDRGVALGEPEITEYGMKQVFVPDPDGYSVCFESPV